MKTVFGTAMHLATQLTREQKVVEAARLIKRALLGRDHAPPLDERAPERSRLAELKANLPEAPGAFEQPRPDSRIARAGGPDAAPQHHPAARAKNPWERSSPYCVRARSSGIGPHPGAIREIAQSAAGAGARWGRLSRAKLHLRGGFERL